MIARLNRQVEKTTTLNKYKRHKTNKRILQSHIIALKKNPTKTTIMNIWVNNNRCDLLRSHSE